jgi:hypothetical protein
MAGAGPRVGGASRREMKGGTKACQVSSPLDAFQYSRGNGTVVAHLRMRDNGIEPVPATLQILPYCAVC